MITITNEGPFDDPDKGGERNYSIRIRKELIATFKHCRRDGLANCLRAAARAVEAEEATRLQDFVESVSKVEQFAKGMGGRDEGDIAD